MRCAVGSAFKSVPVSIGHRLGPGLHNAQVATRAKRRYISTCRLEAADGGAQASPVKRVHVADWCSSQAREDFDLSRPCVLTGILTPEECEAWCDALFEDFAGVDVDYQIRNNGDGRSKMYRSSLASFVRGLQEESTHQTSWYLLEEHLIEQSEARESLKATLDGIQAVLGPDEFELFPPAVRPQKSCLIVGGCGARSFLHSDPMEWMGWNVLLEGRKTWTFLPPSEEMDDALQAYRLSTNAFGEYSISAGWQSDVDLYQYGARVTGADVGCAWPIAREGRSVMRQAISVVQQPGEVMLIPPRYWHQVYHQGPSIAVASQYMDANTRRGVFRHILAWCGVAGFADIAVSLESNCSEPAQQVHEVLKAALEAQLGHEEGLRAIAAIYEPSR